MPSHGYIEGGRDRLPGDAVGVNVAVELAAPLAACFAAPMATPRAGDAAGSVPPVEPRVELAYLQELLRDRDPIPPVQCRFRFGWSSHLGLSPRAGR
jgi:hypothetical protein